MMLNTAQAQAHPPPPPLLPLPSTTWAGEAAVYLPRPSQPFEAAGTTPRQGHGGVWLKAAAPARLRVAGANGGRSAALELSLPNRPLLRVALSAGGDGGSGGESGGASTAEPAAAEAPPLPPLLLEDQCLLLLPHGQFTFVFKFYDGHEAADFARVMDSLKAAAEAAAAAAPPTIAAPPGAARHQQQGHQQQAASAAADDAELRRRIRAFAADPDFDAYVARVEALWDEVAAEAEAEAEDAAPGARGG